MEFEQSFLLLDGAMGTMLQRLGLKPGAMPEEMNITNPEAVLSIHRAYARAGSRVLYCNTFGASPGKAKRAGWSAEEIISAGVRLCRRAAEETGARVALDVGPLGEMLEPLGSLSFEDAYEQFAVMARCGAAAGADLIVIETMTDLYEAKAALLAAKENTALPVCVTMSFDSSGRTFTGCTIAAMAHTLEGLGVDALGVNCSLGPGEILPLIQELRRHTRLPIVAKPNAGLPDPVDGHYSLSPRDFAREMLPLLRAGAALAGGCCGTGPEYILALKEAMEAEGKRVPPAPEDTPPLVCTATRALPLYGVRLIGERMNPTGKKRFQQALLENDLDYIVDVAVQQADAGADLLDVNVGHPGVDEVKMLPRVVKAVQAAVDTPLQLDSVNPRALEAALRVYNGKAVVNSVSGKEESLQSVLPLVKKYGAAVVGLTLDENGIPDTAEKRLAIAEKIVNRAMEMGIPRQDVFIDCLTLTVSAQQDQAEETLRAVTLVRKKLGLQTVLGVSNISFGLPNRPLITQAFLIRALHAGLTLPIVNPNQKEIMDAVFAFRALSGEDEKCGAYLSRFAQSPAESKPAVGRAFSLEEAIRRGLKAEAGRAAREALQTEAPLSLVEGRLIPALDAVGADYEKGIVFLPQLLSAAQAAQAVFEEIRAALERTGGEAVQKGLIILATVQGDIHDIGKNIVKTVLQNYGYQVVDLGRDVAPEAVVAEAKARRARMVGLSALMTTTLPAMEETVRQLRRLETPPFIVVGGAVVTAEFARAIGADAYARDARDTVAAARRVFGG